MTQGETPETPLPEETRLQELLLAALRTEAERLSQAAGALTQSLAHEQPSDRATEIEGSLAEIPGSEETGPPSPPTGQ